MAGDIPTPLRVALVEDHEIVRAGVAEILARAGITILASVATVGQLLTLSIEVDLVVLDLRLADGSSPDTNVESIRAWGAETLVLTSGDDPKLTRAAARAGVLGVIRKTAEPAALVDAIRSAGSGEVVPTTDWAAALDSDRELVDAKLSPREREVLALYASGQKAQSVAYRTGLSKDTVSHYISRIRAKYATVGRPAPTKVDLLRRATEDGLLPDDL